jgi:hypothetical protein
MPLLRLLDGLEAPRYSAEKPPVLSVLDVRSEAAAVLGRGPVGQYCVSVFARTLCGALNRGDEVIVAPVGYGIHIWTVRLLGLILCVYPNQAAGAGGANPVCRCADEAGATVRACVVTGLASRCS